MTHGSNMMQGIWVLRLFSFLAGILRESKNKKRTLNRMGWRAYHAPLEPGQWIICFKAVIALKIS